MAKSKDVVVIKFGEIWLKGRNRDLFIKRLYDNIYSKISDEKFDSFVLERDRFVIYLNKKSNTDSIIEKLAYVFGISSYSRAKVVDNSLTSIVSEVKSMAKGKKKVRLQAHRSYKDTKFNSFEIVSAIIKKEKTLGFGLDKESDYTIYINVTSKGSFVYDNRIKGLGGLPVGSSGRAISLLSGGIDSPVSSFFAMRRGLEVTYIHMHAFPKNEEAASGKISELVEILKKYSPQSRIYYLPSHIFQSAIIKAGDKYELVLLKRFLYKIGEKIANEEKADALVSGDSLGQVASQTLKNLTASQNGINKFIFRPLVGMDKQEIIAAAKKIGTYETSIKTYKDVCSMNARNPSLSAESETIDRIYNEMNLDKVLNETYKKRLVIDL